MDIMLFWRHYRDLDRQVRSTLTINYGQGGIKSVVKAKLTDMRRQASCLVDVIKGVEESLLCEFVRRI